MIQTDGYEYNSLLMGTEVGLLIAIAMWGITSVQTARYYADFPSDPIYLKCSVGSIWICETVYIVLQAIHLNQLIWSIVSRQDVFITRTLTASFVLASVLQSSTQAVYAFRMYKLWNKPYLPLLCWVGSAYALVSGITFAILGVGRSLQGVLVLRRSHGWLMASCCLTTGAVDIIITISFCYLFKRDRKYVGGRTLKILDKLYFWSIQTGMATSLAAVAAVSMIFIPLPGPWLGVFLFLSTLYPLALVALLNGRSYLKALDEGPSQTISMISSENETKLVIINPSRDASTEQRSTFDLISNTEVLDVGGSRTGHPKTITRLQNC